DHSPGVEPIERNATPDRYLPRLPSKDNSSHTYGNAAHLGRPRLAARADGTWNKLQRPAQHQWQRDRSLKGIGHRSVVASGSAGKRLFSGGTPTAREPADDLGK